MTKQEIAEKLGWISPNYMKTGCIGWLDPNGKPRNVPDWENDLNQQEKDIWPWLLSNKMMFSFHSCKSFDKGNFYYCFEIWEIDLEKEEKPKRWKGLGDTVKEACWNAILKIRIVNGE